MNLKLLRIMRIARFSASCKIDQIGHSADYILALLGLPNSDATLDSQATCWLGDWGKPVCNDRAM